MKLLFVLLFSLTNTFALDLSGSFMGLAKYRKAPKFFGRAISLGCGYRPLGISMPGIFTTKKNAIYARIIQTNDETYKYNLLIVEYQKASDSSLPIVFRTALYGLKQGENEKEYIMGPVRSINNSLAPNASLSAGNYSKLVLKDSINERDENPLQGAYISKPELHYGKGEPANIYFSGLIFPGENYKALKSHKDSLNSVHTNETLLLLDQYNSNDKNQKPATVKSMNGENIISLDLEQNGKIKDYRLIEELAGIFTLEDINTGKISTKALIALGANNGDDIVTKELLIIDINYSEKFQYYYNK